MLTLLYLGGFWGKLAVHMESDSKPNQGQKPLFHPKGHLTRALWSDQSVLYQENPPVWEDKGNCRLAAKLESLLKTKQQQQDAHELACPKLAKLFGESLAKEPELPPKKKLNTPVTLIGLLLSLARAWERQLM